MSRLKEILRHNQAFVEAKGYERYKTTKIPEKKLVVLTCMDTRLGELLPKAMNLNNGDAKVIKNAGAIVSHPFGSVMRSILVAIYELNAVEVCVVGHYDCGMTGLKAEEALARAREKGVSADKIDALIRAGIDLNGWLTGFDSVAESVRQSVDRVRRHPMLPPGILVHGLIMHPVTGSLDVVVDGTAP